MLKGILLKTTGEIKLVEYEDTLETLQSYVEGLIEYVTIGRGVSIIVNEEGKILGKDYNANATQLCAYDIIVGDALVVATENGENVSLSDEQIKLVYETLEDK